jgi:hypothetical protein
MQALPTSLLSATDLPARARTARHALGPVPTNQLKWLQPHEGNRIDILFRARVFQSAEL